MIDDDRTARTGYEELDWRLETFAAARLTAEPDAVRRMRKAVVLRAADLAAIREFERQRLAAEAERERLARRTVRGWMGVHRRASAAFLAASLTFASAAAVFAAGPGSPLYGTRVWLQTSLLPAAADARTAAHLDLLEQRVEDAEHAAGGGDTSGVEAALSAYIAELQIAIQDASGDPVRLAQLQHALQVHLLLLEKLQADAPAGAQSAVHQAINDSRKVAHHLQAAGRPSDPPSQGGGGNGGDGPRDGRGNN
jgi:hypothetical protein